MVRWKGQLPAKPTLSINEAELDENTHGSAFHTQLTLLGKRRPFENKPTRKSMLASKSLARGSFFIYSTLECKVNVLQQHSPTLEWTIIVAS